MRSVQWVLEFARVSKPQPITEHQDNHFRLVQLNHESQTTPWPKTR